MIGVPLGNNLATGAAVCFDPVSWFQRAQLISTPSMFVLGKPGLGKSSLTRRRATGLAGYGVLPLVLGDMKPDYVDLIQALYGQVITLGRGRGYLNILDPARPPAPPPGCVSTRRRAAGPRRSGAARRSPCRATPSGSTALSTGSSSPVRPRLRPMPRKRRRPRTRSCPTPTGAGTRWWPHCSRSSGRSRRRTAKRRSSTGRSSTSTRRSTGCRSSEISCASSRRPPTRSGRWHWPRRSRPVQGDHRAARSLPHRPHHRRPARGDLLPADDHPHAS